MTRDELTALVKVKLEEISPFEEPTSFIVAAGDPDYDKVKPILSYIEKTLDHAAVFCLTNLPTSLLAKDIEQINLSASVDNRGVGHAAHTEYSRLVRLKAESWLRECTTFITTESPMYSLQQNWHTRGGIAKPVVVFNPEYGELSLFSFPHSYYNQENVPVSLWHIPLYDTTTGVERTAESVLSPIHDYIALACASQVLDIMEEPQRAALLRQQYNIKLESILH